MGLISAIRDRFFPPELCRVAKTGDVAAIAECLSRTTVFVIAADLGDSFPFDTQQNAVIAAIEAAAQKKSFDGDIHKYEIDGEVLLPVFTDLAAAELFCGAYCSLLGHVHVFRLFTVPGTYIRNWIADDDIITLNPQSNNEIEIDRSKSKAIRTNLNESNNLNEAQFVSLALPMEGISRTVEFSPET